MRKNWKSYVCPHCFNQINNCTCELVPYTLIGIDEEMQYAIKNLNQNGYFTRNCCCGHTNKKTEGQYFLSVYIEFVDNIDTDKLGLPMGWRKRGRAIYSPSYWVKRKEDFYKRQEREIQNLNFWVNKISNL